jgi:hypothetical protein
MAGRMNSFDGTRHKVCSMIWKFMGISTLIMFYIQERRKSFGVQEIPLSDAVRKTVPLLLEENF